jgi:hypothetical protein
MQDVQFICSVAEPRQRETTGKNRLALQRREPRAVSDPRDRINLDARWRQVAADYMGCVIASKTASGGLPMDTAEVPSVSCRNNAAADLLGTNALGPAGPLGG